eukprot:symbB.v1.2.022457.t1/scaffold1993.1/size93368/2
MGSESSNKAVPPSMPQVVPPPGQAVHQELEGGHVMFDKLSAVPGSTEVCRFGKSCQRAGCWYTHPEGRLIDLNPTKALCFRGASCDKIDCWRLHPQERESIVSPPSDFVLFLDEIQMRSRPDIKPAKSDREVFIDPFPAEHGRDELREFLAAFGEVDDVAWNRLEVRRKMG